MVGFGQVGEKLSVSFKSLFVCSRKVKWKSSKYKHMIKPSSPCSDSPFTPLSSNPVTPNHGNAPFSFTDNRADIIPRFFPICPMRESLCICQVTWWQCKVVLDVMEYRVDHSHGLRSMDIHPNRVLNNNPSLLNPVLCQINIP